MKLDKIIKILQRTKIKILSLRDIKKLFEIDSDNTAYKTAESLIKKGILERLKKGLYASTLNFPEDFEVANRLSAPSYVSLETALSFYGILSQFPYPITSITPRKTRRFEVQGKEFEYVHIQTSFFWGYEKQKGFLIASPEKALIDEIYFMAKGWRKIDLTELDLSKLNKKKFKIMAKKIKYRPFQNLLKALSI